MYAGRSMLNSSSRVYCGKQISWLNFVTVNKLLNKCKWSTEICRFPYKIIVYWYKFLRSLSASIMNFRFKHMTLYLIKEQVQIKLTHMKVKGTTDELALGINWTPIPPLHANIPSTTNVIYTI